MNKNPIKLPYEEYKSIYGRVPRLCVDLIFIDGDGVLLIERAINPGKGNWHFPGGTVLMGESIEDSLKRIALEETGLTILDHGLIGYMEFDETDNPYYHTVSMVFRINEFRGTLRGGDQGRNLAFHTAIADKIISEHKDFLLKTNILK